MKDTTIDEMFKDIDGAVYEDNGLNPLLIGNKYLLLHYLETKESQHLFDYLGYFQNNTLESAETLRNIIQTVILKRQLKGLLSFGDKKSDTQEN